MRKRDEKGVFLAEHGCVGTPTYRSWTSMLKRCRNPNFEHAHRYSGRGITVCDHWLSFENFLADMGERPSGTSLERKENELGYQPGNCKWATKAEQSRNTRRNVFLEFEGRSMCVVDWATVTGLKAATIYARYHKGWSPERILSPVK